MEIEAHELMLTKAAHVELYQSLTINGKTDIQAFQSIQSFCQEAGYQARYSTYKSFRKNVIKKI